MTHMPSTRRHLFALVAGLTLITAAPALASENGDPVAAHSRALIFGTPGEYHQALKAFKTRGEAVVFTAENTCSEQIELFGDPINITVE